MRRTRRGLPRRSWLGRTKRCGRSETRVGRRRRARYLVRPRYAGSRLLIRDLTILIPAYNESRRIQVTLDKVFAYAKQRFEHLEVIVVDDGSDDDMGAFIAKTYGDRVRVVRQPMRRGKGAAIRRGVTEARTTWILFCDADLSIPLEELEQFEPHTDRVPIVIGSKRAPGSHVEYPKVRRFLGGIGQALISIFVVSGFHDTQAGFKLYRRDVAQRLFAAQTIDGFGFDFEVLFLAKRLGYGVAEVPIHCEHKIGGTVRFTTYVTVMEEIFTVLWNRLRGAYPKR